MPIAVTVRDLLTSFSFKAVTRHRSLLEWDVVGISILMGPYESRPCVGSALTASLLLIELQFWIENDRVRS